MLPPWRPKFARSRLHGLPQPSQRLGDSPLQLRTGVRAALRVVGRAPEKVVEGGASFDQPVDLLADRTDVPGDPLVAFMGDARLDDGPGLVDGHARIAVPHENVGESDQLPVIVVADATDPTTRLEETLLLVVAQRGNAEAEALRDLADRVQLFIAHRIPPVVPRSCAQVYLSVHR